MNGDHNCDENASCSNTDGSFVCTCNDGYQGNGTTCGDVNECELGTFDCSALATCNNTIGSYSCTCVFGYESDGIQCSAPAATQAVLVLSNSTSTNKPMLVSFEGKSRVRTVRSND